MSPYPGHKPRWRRSDAFFGANFRVSGGVRPARFLHSRGRHAMPLQLPCRLCADVADCLVGSPSLQAAYDAIHSRFFESLQSESSIFVKKASGWARVAGRVDSERETRWRRNLEQLPDDVPVVSRLGEEGAPAATAIWVADAEPAVVIVEGDWTASQDVLTACASVMRAELRSIRAQHVSRRAHELLTGGHRLVRELTTTRDPDVLAARIVNRVADMFGAERVSLAVYDKDEKTLAIAATHGFPRSLVQDVRVKPGEWVIGRVATTRKVLAVPDVRLLPGNQSHRHRYRSHAFAVAPLFYGTETVGVLSITDRRDGAGFETIDRIALRAIGALAGAAIVAADIAGEMARLERAASVDSVTGLLNRNFLDTRLNQEVGRSHREQTELAVLMADIDDFKSINDTYGHQVGDAVLKHVGEIIQSSVRVFDVCARYGGDEFAILMPNSDQARALACAERIRQRTAQFVKDDPSLPRLTISVGVAVGDARDGAADLVLRADRALYEAKASGKNSVRGQSVPTTASPLSSEPSATRPTDAEDAASAPLAPTEVQLPYVLVADANAERRKIYSQIAGKFRLGLLIARDGAETQRLVDQFGPPVILAVDLSHGDMSGTSGLGRAAMRNRLMSIVAFSPARELREFSRASATDGPQFAVLHPNSKPAVVRAVIERILQHRLDGAVDPSAEQAAQTRRALEDLTARGKDVVDTAGLAVYLKDGRDGLLRGVVRWASDAALTRSQYFLPRVVDRVMTDGELVILGDVGAPSPLDHAGEKARDNTHGIVAAPVKQGGDVIGAICAFDDTPVRLSESTLTAFEQLGAWGLESATPPPATPARDEDVVTPPAAPTPMPADAVDAALAGNAPSQPTEVPKPPRPRSDDPEWQPTLIDRQRGEFEVARELARARREQRQLSVVLFDVSERAQQRPAGPEMAAHDTLQHVVDTFVRAVRQSDLPIRWSGNELLLVLPGLAGVEARAVAERVRAAMEAGGHRRVAVSGGVAQLELDEQFGAAVSRARAKVAIALHHGNNRVS